MFRIVILFLFAAGSGQQVTAQSDSTFSLQQCIDSALKNNIQVRQAKLSSEASKITLNQARSNTLPSVAGVLNQGLNVGRNIDPFTNDYVNNTVNYGAYGITTNMVVFNGGSLRNSIRQNEYAYDAANESLQGAKQRVVLNVIAAYLRVLSLEEQLAIAQAQEELSVKQVKRVELLEKQGVVPPSQLSDMKGQLFNDQLAIVDLQNQLETAKLQLAQEMNVAYRPGMRLEKINVENMLAPYVVSTTEIHQAAMERFPEVKAAELRTKSAAHELKSVKGLRYPTVLLGTTVQTLYTSSAENAKGRVGFADQFSNNMFTTVNLGVRIPIFMANTIRNRIRMTNVTLQNNALAEEATKVGVRQEIERAHLEMTNAYNRYQTLSRQVEAYRLSFRAAEARFNAGVDSPFDYLMAKNNLDRANLNFITAKYDYILRRKVLDYYQNNQ